MKWNQSVQATITKYHRLGSLKNRNFFFHSSGGWMSKLRVPAQSGCGESLFFCLLNVSLWTLIPSEGLTIRISSKPNYLPKALSPNTMTNLDSVVKSRDIPLPTKVCIVKATVFPVVMYRCESQTVKKVEHQRIDAFKLQCYRRLLSVPWTARRSSQSILKEINPEYTLEVLMLKLNLQYFGHVVQRANSLEKTLML